MGWGCCSGESKRMFKFSGDGRKLYDNIEEFTPNGRQSTRVLPWKFLIFLPTHQQKSNEFSRIDFTVTYFCIICVSIHFEHLFCRARAPKMKLDKNYSLPSLHYRHFVWKSAINLSEMLEKKNVSIARKKSTKKINFSTIFLVFEENIKIYSVSASPTARKKTLFLLF